MAWGRSPDGQTYNFRMSAVATTSAVAPGGSAVAQMTVTEQHTLFWENVQSNFYNVAICDADGTRLAHTRDGASSYASRIAQFRFTVSVPASAPAGAEVVVYLHFGTAATVSADPSTGALVSTISANLINALTPVSGPHMILGDGGSWNQSTASATPTASPSFGIAAGEARAFVLPLGARFLYNDGALYNGSAVVDDLEWVYATASGSGIVGSVRAWVNASGVTVYAQAQCSSGNSLITFQCGWSSFSGIEKHFARLVGIAPAV
jgi:hypothetical protein